MAYCTQSDIEEEIGEEKVIELTDDEGLGTVNAARVTKAIAAADAEINSYLAQRYSVPMTAGLELLKDLCVNLALERLYGRRPGSLPEDRADRITAVRRLLADIATGKATLGETPPPPVDSGGSMFEGADRNFSRSKLEGF